LARRKERDDAKLFSIVGQALVQNGARSPDVRLMLKQILQNAVTEERERQFLSEKGWL
jgi:hypothetical protein